MQFTSPQGESIFCLSLPILDSLEIIAQEENMIIAIVTVITCNFKRKPLFILRNKELHVEFYYHNRERPGEMYCHRDKGNSQYNCTIKTSSETIILIKYIFLCLWAWFSDVLVIGLELYEYLLRSSRHALELLYKIPESFEGCIESYHCRYIFF